MMRYSLGYYGFLAYSVLLTALGFAAFITLQPFEFLAILGAPMHSPMAHAMVPITFFFGAFISIMFAFGCEFFSRLTSH